MGGAGAPRLDEGCALGSGDTSLTACAASKGDAFLETGGANTGKLEVSIGGSNLISGLVAVDVLAGAVEVRLDANT